MFYTAIKIAQIIFVLWPLVIILVIFTMYRGTGGIKGIFTRLTNSLLVAWLLLLAIWLTGTFEPNPIPSFLDEPLNTWLFFGGLALLLLIKIVPALARSIKNQQKLSEIRSIQQLVSLKPDQFEELVTTTYRHLGFKANRVGHTGDHGVDVELRARDGHKWIVQCKRYHGAVGEAIVRDLYGTMVSERAARAILVTTATITFPAESWARGKPIELIDGFGLLRLMAQARAHAEERFFLRMALKVATWLRPPPQKLSRSTPPLCPRCRLPMTPHPLRAANRPGRVLYRCVNYPECRAVVEVREDVPTFSLSTAPNPHDMMKTS